LEDENKQKGPREEDVPLPAFDKLAPSIVGTRPHFPTDVPSRQHTPLHLHARLQQHRSVYSLQYWCMREKDRTDVVPLGRQQPGASGRELLASLGPDLSGDDSGLAAWPMSKPLGHRREANHGTTRSTTV